MREDRPLPRLTARLQRDLVIGLQLVLFVAAWLVAFELRFETVPPRYTVLMIDALPLVVAIKVAAFVAFRLHRSWLRYAGVRDLESIVAASAAGGGAILILLFLLRPAEWTPIPRSVLLLDPMVSVLALGGLRFAGRLGHRRLPSLFGGRRTRIAIVGAGDAAEQLLQQIDRNRSIGYRVVALFDDDPTKRGLRIHGVPVVGTPGQLADYVADNPVDQVVIATPSATGQQMRDLVSACNEAGVDFRVVPAIDDLLGGRISWSAIRPVDIRDLLRRDPVELDQDQLEGLLRGKTVLITGAGGSIGSELVRQVARWRPRRILALDQAENPIFDLQRSMGDLRGAAFDLVPVICNVRDARRLDALFRHWRPTVVLHAAAHKHVPLMEYNVLEALRNNVLGTRTVAEAARPPRGARAVLMSAANAVNPPAGVGAPNPLAARVGGGGRPPGGPPPRGGGGAPPHGATHFVMISTDKAVNPTSVMGTTKRMAELVVQELGASHPETRFVSVRFGNVLGSRGSVVPIFKAQIAAGGPVTVTHEDMVRYFMTIPEASQLVLQAAALGSGGEVFILDMGEPVRIVDLARDLIRLSGLEPDVDVGIRFTGIRPGEKLFEELAHGTEKAVNTHHPKVFVGRVCRADPVRLQAGLDRLETTLRLQDLDGALALMRELVPEARLTAGAQLDHGTGGVSLTRLRLASSGGVVCA